MCGAFSVAYPKKGPFEPVTKLPELALFFIGYSNAMDSIVK
jgi:hypothetical protein